MARDLDHGRDLVIVRHAGHVVDETQKTGQTSARQTRGAAAEPAGTSDTAAAIVSSCTSTPISTLTAAIVISTASGKRAAG
jgi:hypothetical protein